MRPQRIITHPRRNQLAGAPLADGIVLVECQSQRVNVAMAGGRNLRSWHVLQSLPDGILVPVGEWFDRINIAEAVVEFLLKIASLTHTPR